MDGQEHPKWELNLGFINKRITEYDMVVGIYFQDHTIIKLHDNGVFSKNVNDWKVAKRNY